MDEPKARVQLMFSCKNLVNKDTLSLSDPQIFIHLFNLDSRSWIEVGRTEVVWNSLNPLFTTPFTVDYKFEEVQSIRFTVVDVDKGEGSGRIQDQDFLGQVETNLAKIFVSPNQIFKSELYDEQNRKKFGGEIQVILEEIPTNDTISVAFSCSARELDAKNSFAWLGWGKSDPFIIISRSREDGTWVPVFQNHYLKDTLDPVWPKIRAKLSTLVGGDRDRTLQIAVWDWESSGRHQFIGDFKSSLNELERRKGQEIFLKNGNKISGKFIVNNIEFIQTKSFLEYIREGLDINLITAIDFTSSNGDPSQPNSLHYRAGNYLNPYQLAIRAIGEILLEYDSDKKVPVYGFGAKFRDGSISHCFPLNGVIENPEVYGVDGILDAYNHALNNLTLWGPTNFSPILRATENIIKNCLNLGLPKYFILMIVTDGEITDMEATIQTVIDMSILPLSIVIVGVGNANFENMRILDGDNGLFYNGRKAARDIVQFVPFSQIQSPHILARETLAEIPEQLTGYMQAK